VALYLKKLEKAHEAFQHFNYLSAPELASGYASKMEKLDT
jgi:hypothetical protein